MIRFVLAFCVLILMLGSVALCQWGVTRSIRIQLSREVHNDVHVGEVSGRALRYTIAVTPSFSAREDPFALVQPGAEGDVPRILVREGDRELLRWIDDVEQGVTIRAEEVVPARIPVEWYVEATPSPDAARHPCAVRIRVFAGDVLYGEQTLWSDGDGASVSGRVTLDLKPHHGSVDRGLTGGGS